MSDKCHTIIADFYWSDKNACGMTLEPDEVREVLAFLRAAEDKIADLRLELLSAHGEAGANLDRAVKAEAALAALRDDPSALTVAYLAGVESERNRARIESGGP